MALKFFKPNTPARRLYSSMDNSDLSKVKPLRSLLRKRSRTGGRNVYGRMTAINVGGGHKMKYRVIDFARNKLNIVGTVATIEYDPNRNARIALIHYIDGEKRYIIAPDQLVVGQKIMSGESAEILPGNALPLKSIPVGQNIHNIEIKRGAGGKLVRSAGMFAQLLAKEGAYVTVRMPSGEMRKIHAECFATIGTVSNADYKNIILGKAGRARWKGIRPHTRGIAKNPVDHPMGGRTNGGKHPCSPSGVPAKGYKTRKNKSTQKFIVARRK